MKGINIIFPHQLFQTHALYENGYDIYMIEEPLFFSQYKFHKMKLAYHRATMKAHACYLKSKDLTVHYIETADQKSDLEYLIDSLSNQKIELLCIIDQTDYFLENKIKFLDISSKLWYLINSPFFLKFKHQKPKNLAQIEKLNEFVRLKTRTLSVISQKK